MVGMFDGGCDQLDQLYYDKGNLMRLAIPV